MSAARIGELERKQSNHVKNGKVIQADYAAARVKVQLGENQTAWLPWVTGRAGGNKSWRAPEVGEQVLVISNGDLAQGFVLPGVFCTENPANGNSADVERTDYSDGTFTLYNRATHLLLANLCDSGTAHVAIGNCVADMATDHFAIMLGGTTVRVTSSAVAIVAGGTTLTIDSSGVTSSAAITAQAGNITATAGDVTAQTVSLHGHVHTAVSAGSALSGAPKP